MESVFVELGFHIYGVAAEVGCNNFYKGCLGELGMPIHEYTCGDCGDTQDYLHKMDVKDILVHRISGSQGLMGILII